MADENLNLTQDQLDSIIEESYKRGRHAYAKDILSKASVELGADMWTKEQLLIERNDAIQALRNICEEHGDNDWPDDLYLADIITKYLGDCL